jgi:hypothetical protein
MTLDPDREAGRASPGDHAGQYPWRRPRNAGRRVHRVRVSGVYKSPPSGGGPHADMREDVIRP